MQVRGNLQVASLGKAPCLVVIAFDSATHTPSFALIQESPNEIPTINYNGVAVETRGLLDDCTLETARPNNGGGIIRRTCSITISTEHEKGYPYFNGPLTKGFYYGGRSVKDFYFAIYAIERQFMYDDIRDGLFFGIFQVESGMDWVETNGETTIPLIEILINDETIVGATTEAIPESFFLFNPWFDGNIVPKVFGQVPRIRLLNSFPSISVKQVASSINGVVGSNYTAVSATIILERGADKSSVLRQLVAIGGTVKIKMHDGEVIAGTLAYDSGTGDVTLTVTTRNTYYSQGQGYTRAVSGSPTEWGVTVGYPPFFWGSSVIINGRNLIQDPNGYMEASIHFYDTTDPVDSDTAYTVSTHMTGWDDETSNNLNHVPWEKTTAPIFNYASSAGLSARFQTAVFGDPMGTNWTPGQHLYFANTTATVSFYFNDPATSVNGTGSIGDPWQMVGIVPGSITYECYIRNGFSHFSSDHIYCEGAGHLIKIPTGNVVSVTDSTTVGGLTNMLKVVLTASPIDMNIGATANTVYTDAMYKTSTNEDRTESVLYSIMQESSLIPHFAGPNLDGSGLSTDNWLPYIGYLATGAETVTDVIDRVCFQCGSTFRWLQDYFILAQCAYNRYTETDVVISGDTYTKPLLNSTNKYEMYENSARINIGKVKTSTDAAGFEYIPLYFEVDYGNWEDPFYKPPKQLVNKAIKPDERKFKYAFDLINDPHSAAYAVGLCLSIGHASGLTMIERTLTTDMSLDGTRWEALDPIMFKDFPMVSTSDETNAVLDDFDVPQYLKPSDGKKFIMGAVACVDRAVYSFALDNPKVTVTAKMSQTFTNANGTSIYAPPYPPLPPPNPSNDPANPPGAGGGYSTSHGYGGTYDPMPWSISGDTEVEIDSTDPETATITVNVDSSFIENAGFTWSAVIIDEYNTSGASVTSGNFGIVNDKVNDPYTNPDTTLIVSVNSAWFAPMPAQVVNRDLVVRFTRAIKYNATSSETYDDIYDHHINVTLKDLTDISAS